jgi:AAA domain
MRNMEILPIGKKRVLQLGPIEVTTGDKSVDSTRMAILLWGPSGAGKTTFAATAPGEKLWISLGSDEHVPVARRKDVRIADMSGLSIDEFMKHARNENPFGLDRILSENHGIGTVVFDSMTALSYMSLQKAVRDGIGGSASFRPSLEFPGISAYGGRNAITLEIMTELLKVTSKHNVHIIFTAHEDDPTMVKHGKDDIVDYIGIMLGGKIVNNVAWRLSEIWYYSQSDLSKRNRRLAIRATRKRKPMKTRMFSDKGEPEFEITYDADKPDKGQTTIASWYDKWLDGGGEKLNVPKA